MAANCGELFKDVTFILRLSAWIIIILAVILLLATDDMVECYKYNCDLTTSTDGAYLIITSIYMACFFADQINHDLFEKCIIGTGGCLFVITALIAIGYAIRYKLNFIVAILNLACGVVMIADLVFLVKGPP